MFKIQDIDPLFYRKQTRKATLIVMLIFIVIGFISASLTVHLLGDYSNNKLVLNLLGAFVGLMLTGFIVKTFFADKDWMKEAIYAWRLKRNLMYITNVLDKVKADGQLKNEHALKILRFYHLGLEQMHKLDDNSHELIELAAEKRALETQMQALDLPLDQTEFDPQWVACYKPQ